MEALFCGTWSAAEVEDLKQGKSPYAGRGAGLYFNWWTQGLQVAYVAYSLKAGVGLPKGFAALQGHLDTLLQGMGISPPWVQQRPVGANPPGR